MLISINASLKRYPNYHRTFADLLMRWILQMLVGFQGRELKRWVSFKLICCEQFDVSLLEPLSLWPAPWLIDAEINCPGPFGGTIELNAPNLRRLVHHECSLYFAPRPGFFFMALTDLTLSPPTIERPLAIFDLFGWVNIIRQAPRLVCLRLSTYFMLDEFLPGPLERDEIIDLSRLQLLVINGDGPWKLLQYLRFPALTTIKIDGEMSAAFCSRILDHAQCYEHLSHIKRLWIRSTIAYMPSWTIEQGHSFYAGFLARLFPKLDTFIIPFSIYAWSAQEATAYKRVLSLDDNWRARVLSSLRDDTQFPNRAVINGGEKVFKMSFDHPHLPSNGVIEAFRHWLLKARGST